MTDRECPVCGSVDYCMARGELGYCPLEGNIAMTETTTPSLTTASFPKKRVRMVLPGYLGILISSQGPEYVMPVSEANDLVGLICRAKHDGAENVG